MPRKIGSTFQMPLIIMVAYLLFTLLLYAIGPFNWVTYKPVYFWCLQISYILMLIVGWEIGINFVNSNNCEWTENQSNQIVNILSFPLLFNLIYQIISSFRRFGYSNFNVISWVNRIIWGFYNMGTSYNEFQENTITSAQILGGKIYTVFSYFWEFFSLLLVLLGTFYFKKLKISSKIILILTYIVIISMYAASGTNIGVFMHILAIVIFVALKVIRGEKIINKVKWRKKRKWIIIVSITFIVTLSIFFDKIMKSRGGILYWDTPYYNVGGITINKDSMLFRLVPQSWYPFMISAASYLTQGYYGMSEALRLNWEPTFGFGSSRAIMLLLKEYLTDLPYQKSYQHRAEILGWDENVQWHSMYTWFANDLSFPGVAIVMLLFGMVFAIAYKDSIKTNNPYAHFMVYFMTLGAFFIPCNNQLFQSTYTMFSFITVFILWICSRGNKKIRLRIISRR